MIRHFTLRKRILAWFLWRLEVRHSSRLGFDGTTDGTRKFFLDPSNAAYLYVHSLLTEYYFHKVEKERDKWKDEN